MPGIIPVIMGIIPPIGIEGIMLGIIPPIMPGIILPIMGIAAVLVIELSVRVSNIRQRSRWGEQKDEPYVTWRQRISQERDFFPPI
jgi:hypothetical protein